MATNEDLVLKVRAEVDAATKEIKKLSGEINTLSKSSTTNSKSFKDNEVAYKNITGTVSSLTKRVIALGTAFISLQGAKQLISTTADIEKGFIGIAKTTGLTGDALKKMEEDLFSLSTSMAGISIDELQGIAETAGQLGIVGSENILEFTRVIAMMGTATDLTAEQAAQGMAKLGNSLGIPVKDFEKLGSVINELSNTTTATAEDLLNMGQRISGVGKTFGLTGDQVLGLSATLTDVGMSAELGGTAISAVMLKMLQDVDKFAKASGVSVEEFSTMIENEPVKALELFISSIGKLDKAAKIKALTELGLTGNGVSQTMLKLSDNTELLSRNLGTGATAWRENTSLLKEYNVAALGLDAQWERAKNVLQELAYKIGSELMPILKQLIDDFVKWGNSLDEVQIKEFAEDIAGMVKALADVVSVLGGFLSAIGSVIAINPQLFAGILGIVGVMKLMGGLLPTLSAGLINIGGSAKTMVAASTATTTATSSLVAVLRSAIALAGPWGIAFGAMAVAANIATDAYVDGQKKANAATNATTKELNNHSTTMQSISDTYVDASTQMKEYGNVSVATRDTIRKALEAEKLSLEASITKLEQNKSMTEGQTTAYFEMAKSLGTVKASLDTLDAVYTVDMRVETGQIERVKSNIENDTITANVEADASGLKRDAGAAKNNIERDNIVAKVDANVSGLKREAGAVKNNIEKDNITANVDANMSGLEKDADAAKSNIENDTITAKVEADASGLEREAEAAKSDISRGEVVIAVDANTAAANTKITTLKKPTKSDHTVKPNANAVISTINKLKQNTSSTHTIYERVVTARAGGGPIPQKLARGGHFTGSGRVPGYDSTDSDKVNAKLTGGEFVIRRRAVDAIGSSYLHDLNNMRLKVPKLPRFAEGGVFGGGGSTKTSISSDMTPINLNIGGSSFQVMGERDIADALMKFINSEGGF